MFPARTLYSESMDSGQATYDYRYDANLAEEIELKWQARWEESRCFNVEIVEIVPRKKSSSNFVKSDICNSLTICSPKTLIK